MATFAEITHKIARLAHPSPSVDIIRMVERLVLNYRSLILKRDYDRKRHLHDKFVQTAVNIPIHQSKYNPGHSKFRVHKTDRIPSIIRLASGYLIRYVGDNTRTQGYDYVDPNALKMVTYSRYSYRDKLCTIIDNEIYLFDIDHSESDSDTNVNYLTHIRLEAVFEDPRLLFDFEGLDGSRAYDLDHEFPITEDLEQQITQSIIAQELQILNPMRINEVKTDPV